MAPSSKSDQRVARTAGRGKRTDELSGFARWQGILRDAERDAFGAGISPSARNELHRRILRVAVHCGKTADEVVAVITAISKGYALVRAATGWTNAVAGHGVGRTVRCRGEQWRLAMAWGGTETILNALGATSHKPKNQSWSAQVAEIAGRLELPSFITIAVPTRERKGLRQWLELAGNSRQHRLLEFLGCRIGHEATKRIEQWLIEGMPVTNWGGALILAQAFRNTTVHGALSAAKVAEWGLTKPFSQLTDTLGTFTKGVVDRLAAPLEGSPR